MREPFMPESLRAPPGGLGILADLGSPGGDLQAGLGQGSARRSTTCGVAKELPEAGLVGPVVGIQGLLGGSLAV